MLECLVAVCLGASVELNNMTNQEIVHDYQSQVTTTIDHDRIQQEAFEQEKKRPVFAPRDDSSRTICDADKYGRPIQDTCVSK